MKSNNSIDNLFREKLQNYQQSPPPGLFDEVLAGMAAGRRRRKLLFWRIAGIAAALLLAFVAGWEFSNKNQVTKTPAAFTDQSIATTDQQVNDSAGNKETAFAVPAEKSKTGINEPSVTDGNSAGNHSIGLALNTRREPANPDEHAVVGPTNQKTPSIVPLKSLFRMLEQNKALFELRREKELEARGEKLIMSLDQQIMEQNQKNYLAELTASQRGRWLIGAQVSPAYNLDHGSYSQTYASNMIGGSSTNPVDLGGGFSVEYKTGKKLSLQTGIYYAGIGLSSGNSRHSAALDLIASNGEPSYFNTPVTIEADKVMMNSSAGVIEMNQIPTNVTIGTSMDDKAYAATVLVSDARFIQNFQYLEVPLYLRYALLNSRFNIEMLGGFSTNVLIGNDAYLQSGSARSLIGSTQDMRTFNYSGTLGIGLKYGLNKHFYLNLEPRVKYFLNSLNTNSAVKYKPYIFGIYTGVSYEF